MSETQKKSRWNFTICAQQQLRTPQPLNNCFRQWMVRWKKINLIGLNAYVLALIIEILTCRRSSSRLYYYFNGSTRRKRILIDYLQFVGLELEKMSRFVKTRWLCLERCCDKEQQKCPALKSLFTSRTGSNLRQDKGNEEDDEKSTEKRFKRLKKAFTGPLIEVYISVFTSALLLFTHYNLFLQRSDPQAHNVHPMTQSLTKKMHPVFWKGKRYQMWPSRRFKMSQTAFL